MRHFVPALHHRLPGSVGLCVSQLCLMHVLLVCRRFTQQTAVLRYLRVVMAAGAFCAPAAAATAASYSSHVRRIACTPAGQTRSGIPYWQYQFVFV
jgi:hypothetical protein